MITAATLRGILRPNQRPSGPPQCGSESDSEQPGILVRQRIQIVVHTGTGFGEQVHVVDRAADHDGIDIRHQGTDSPVVGKEDPKSL
ncbi:hypothetical protein BOX37_13830 [Nocardia mangyaensis]|uniref:Uncharacterized protein n=1 Tax=Nocardia mangyaensis TaxID=2213200 RepID=A0A1J0VS18_9NOCA|nr:hypothetical protein BOX37_13830 [Nocardia mangyaensis]